ncbi:MAG: type IV toxin-antitoxin system AbiEi family antitoxin domain-containing protein [Nitrospira sp.]|nr:type IV toxin-antitoxin system AbiEi family antitoxin domain-containing protein [Nitrospira sp.]
MKKGLGEIERLLFAYVQMRGQAVVRAGDLIRPLHLSAPRERKLLSRLAKAGWIVRVQRGLYLAPQKLPLGGKWSPSEALALNTLMKARNGRYQLSGPNAFNVYGFDEQIPVRLYAYNNRVSGDWKIGALDMTLIKVADSRLGDTAVVAAPDGETTVYSSRVRTLVDAVYDWSRFNGIPRGYEWIRRELTARRISAAELVLCTLRYGDKGTIRRMGVLLEKEGVEEKLLRKLERALTPTKGPIPWIPGKPKRGPVAGRWGVVVNDEASSA